MPEICKSVLNSFINSLISSVKNQKCFLKNPPMVYYYHAKLVRAHKDRAGSHLMNSIIIKTD